MVSMASPESNPTVNLTTPADGSLTLARFYALRRALLVALLMSVFSGALAWYFSLKNFEDHWLATALVKIGQVGVYPELVVVPVETSARALERARSPAFTAALLKKLGLPTEDPTASADAMMLRRSLRLSNPRNSELLEFQVEGKSPEEARQRISAAVGLLTSAHDGISESLIKNLKDLLAQTESKLADDVNERDRLAKLIGSQQGSVSGRGFSESVVLSNLLSNRDQQIHDLTKQRMQILSLLGESRTFPTGLLSEDAVTFRKVKSEKIFKLALAAASIGFLLGLIPVFRLRKSPGAVSRG
jgi:hypothetical protein